MASRTEPVPLFQPEERVDVLVIMAAESLSGPGRQLAGVTRALRAAGIGVRVLVLRRTGHPRPPFAAHLDALEIPHDLVEDRGPLDRGVADAVGDAIQQWRPDILQTHGYKATAAAWLLRRRGMRLPWVGFFHGHTSESLRARLYHMLDRRMLRAADRIVVMSGQQREEFGSHVDRVSVIHNAIVPLPVSDAVGAQPIRRMLLGTAGPRIGVVGRLSHEKGVDVFLRACGRLARSGRAFSAVVAGEGPERSALEQLAAAEGLGDRVLFTGYIDAADVLYTCLDMLVIPSRSEGLPNVLLEALAVDLPVVATSVGAIPDVLTVPGSGTLVEPGSDTALAAAIDDELAAGRGPGASQARLRVARRFSLEARRDRHIELYRNLVPDIGRTMRAGGPPRQ